MRKFASFCLFLVLLQSSLADATLFGQVKGIVHDPQHRPIRGAQVTLRAANSALVFSATTNESGAFTIPAVPLGDYTLTVGSTGFSESHQSLTLASNTSPELHFELQISNVHQSITVNAQADAGNVNSVTPTTLISRLDIAAYARRRPHKRNADDHQLRARSLCHS